MPDPFRPLTNGPVTEVVRLDVDVTARGRVRLNFGMPMPPSFSFPPHMARAFGRLLLEAADKAEGRIVLPPTTVQA